MNYDDCKASLSMQISYTALFWNAKAFFQQNNKRAGSKAVLVELSEVSAYKAECSVQASLPWYDEAHSASQVEKRTEERKYFSL